MAYKYTRKYSKIFSHQGKANQNYTELIPPCPVRMAIIKKIKQNKVADSDESEDERISYSLLLGM